MILFLHHRYRVPGGEERVVAELAEIVRGELGEAAVVLERDSGTLSGAGAAAGLIGGGLRPEHVARAVRETGARIVHAHNLLPTFGWRALAAARAEGARIVLHLHQYRLVCAIGVCFRDGHECLECHGRNTRPGIRHGCRGERGEALAYAAGLALAQRRLLELADVVVAPSRAAIDRLQALGAPLPEHPRVLGGVVRAFADPEAAGAVSTRAGALVASRLAPEKGVDVAVAACARAGIALTVAGDGPQRDALEREAARLGADVRFLGRVGSERLAALRREAAVGLVPSRSAETFGLAAAEAMAAGLPVAASRIGALPELVPEPWLAPPGDPDALAGAMARVLGDPTAGRRGSEIARARCAPEAIAPVLAEIYAAASAVRR